VALPRIDRAAIGGFLHRNYPASDRRYGSVSGSSRVSNTAPYHDRESRPLTLATQNDARAELWIEAGFAELARSGAEGVRVEVLAKNLGVTKGGFYRRFRDRAALMEAMLATWGAGRIASIEAQTSLDGVTARERLRAIIKLYSERMNTAAMAI